METNPYDYNAQVPWQPPQSQSYEWALPATQHRQLPPQQQERIPGSMEQRLGTPQRMPKAHALALAQTLKRWLVVASLVGFGTFSGLAAFHPVGAAANQATQPPSDSVQSMFPPQSSDENNDDFDHHDFFRQQGGSNFGMGNTAPAPVTGTGVS